MTVTPTAAAAAAVLALATAGMSAAHAQTGDGAVELVGDFAHWQKKAITESSGLIWWRDHLITTNDSGDEAVLYVADRTGRATARLTYADARPTDVEALALGPEDTIWVGDIGDNAERRAGVAVYRVPSPGLDADARVPSTRYDLRYPDGSHNAETLLVDPTTGVVYVVTKALLGAVYRAPQPLRADRVNTLAYVGPAPAIVTDGTVAPSGAQVYLRSYATLTVLDYPGFTPRVTWVTPVQPQGEGLANGPDGTVLASTEGARSAIQQWRMPALPATSGSTTTQPTGSSTAATESGATSPSSSPTPAASATDPAGSRTAPVAADPGSPGLPSAGQPWRVIAPILALAAAAVAGLALLRNRRQRRRR